MPALDMQTLLREMVSRGASDLHIKVGISPVYRVNGKLEQVMDARVDAETMDRFLSDIMNREQMERFEKNKEVDFAVGARNMGRFRVNVFRQRGSVAMVIRHIKAEIPSFAELKLPDVILDLSLKERGLILVTGTTGSGKSTCLAAMIDHINQHTTKHVITIEDPIEFLHKDKNSIITQRELGVDTLSYANALRAALRQDPDVLLVGEIRDLETMQIALTAADTGHMVFATIHTTSASETITRVLSMYPPHQHEEVRLMLSDCLVGI
ncbi:MAG TPA: PilT/PilU family type 4a pilus ATPase, partial [Fibrobacteraceae bacterium]|nr:PilT/PilU family type 4a pilus ATPase [Fibrobacteraceae bacterium]